MLPREPLNAPLSFRSRKDVYKRQWLLQSYFSCLRTSFLLVFYPLTIFYSEGRVLNHRLNRQQRFYNHYWHFTASSAKALINSVSCSSLYASEDFVQFIQPVIIAVFSPQLYHHLIPVSYTHLHTRFRSPRRRSRPGKHPGSDLFAGFSDSKTQPAPSPSAALYPPSLFHRYIRLSLWLQSETGV